MNIIDKNKAKVQEKAISNWEKSNCRGAIGACTGSGKSKIFVDIIDKMPEKWLLVVPTIKLRDEGWKDEFDKWNKGLLYSKYIDKTCYASLKNYDLSNYKGVCLDEGHNITFNNTRPFRDPKVSKDLKILFLSATIPIEWEKQLLMYELNIKSVFTLSLDEGVKLGIVAPYEIKVCKIPLDTAETMEIKYKNNKDDRNKSFYTSEKANYKYLTEIINKKQEEGKDTKFYIFNRMRFIYNLESKMRVAKKILSLIEEDTRILVFGQSIKQIEELCKDTYHSKTNSDKYNDFINEKLNRLGVVMALNEGTNIPNLDAALIVQLNSKTKDLIQRIGRIVRYRDNHIATIYILVSEDTVDENWLNNALSSFNSSNISYIDYNKLINGNDVRIAKK